MPKYEEVELECRDQEHSRKETDELYGPGTYDAMPLFLQKGRKGIYIVVEPESSRSYTRLGSPEFPTVVTLGTKDLSDNERAWLLAHELAHSKLGHGTRMGMKPQDALKEEEDAWRLAKYRNPSIPDKFIERALDTYRRIRGRGLTIVRLQQHVKELSEDPNSVTEYLEDVIADSQTPDRVKLVAERTLQRIEVQT